MEVFENSSHLTRENVKLKTRPVFLYAPANMCTHVLSPLFHHIKMSSSAVSSAAGGVSVGHPRGSCLPVYLAVMGLGSGSLPGQYFQLLTIVIFQKAMGLLCSYSIGSACLQKVVLLTDYKLSDSVIGRLCLFSIDSKTVPSFHLGEKHLDYLLLIIKNFRSNCSLINNLWRLWLLQHMGLVH